MDSDALKAQDAATQDFIKAHPDATIREIATFVLGWKAGHDWASLRKRLM